MTEPTREQLLAEIARLQKAATKLERQNTRLTTKLKTAQRRYTSAERHAANLEVRIEQSAAKIESLKLKAEIDAALAKVAVKAIPFIFAVATELSKYLSDDSLHNDMVLKEFRRFIRQFDAARHGHSVYLKACKRSEKLPVATKAEMDEITKVVKQTGNDMTRSAVHQIKNSLLVNAYTTGAMKNLGVTPEGDTTAGLLCQVLNRELSEEAKAYRTDMEDTPSLGRQVVARDLTQQEFGAAAIPDNLACPVCGGNHFVQTRVSASVDMIGTVQKFVDLLKVCVPEQTYAECKHCGTVVPVFDDTIPMALNPKRQITIDTCVAIADIVRCGVPMNRTEAMFFRGLKLGSSTIGENLLQMAAYAKPMQDAIEAVAHKEAVIVCDETPFDILQAQDRGHQRKLKETDKEAVLKADQKSAAENAEKTTEEHTENTDGDTESKAEELEKGSATYIEAITSTEGSATPFSLYYPMAGRSALKMSKVLEAFNPRCIVSDGYAAYSTIIREDRTEIKHANCWIHLRRKFLQAANMVDQGKFISMNSSEIVLERYMKDIESGEPKPILNGILQAISKMFAEDKSVVRKEDETRWDYLNRKKAHREKYIRWYVDLIDKLVERLKEKAGLAEVNSRCEAGDGAARRKYKSGASPTYYDEPIIYYLNHREKFHYFLEDAECPLSSNEVERVIRPLTIIRNNSYFLQSMEHARGMCTLMSLFETAEQNGIDDPSEWLRTYYYRLAQHCQREQWIEHTRPECEKPKNPYKKFVSWEYEKYWDSMPIDDLLPWNYARAQKEKKSES